jgi:polysaccharide pyruvyl transferase WcaK-like protein
VQSVATDRSCIDSDAERLGEPVRRTYAWLTGQEDNVGDSALRREYVRVLSTTSPLTIWAGRHHGYTNGLTPRPNDELSRSFTGWWAALALDAVRGRANVALNAGEFTLTKRYVAIAFVLLPLLTLVRVRGGAVIWLGAAVPAQTRLTWLFRGVARLCSMIRWRDSQSARLLAPAPTMPDWALATEPLEPTPSRRELLAVSLRGDRPPPSEEWCALVRQAAHRLGLRITVVVQVARDRDRACEVASALEAEIVPWRHDDHRSQEALVRATYRHAAVVLSDRLHALFIAMTEGAVPIGWCESATDKLARNFAVIGLADLAAREPRRLADLDGPQLDNLQRRVATQLARARHELRAVEQEVTKVLLGARHGGGGDLG